MVNVGFIYERDGDISGCGMKLAKRISKNLLCTTQFLQKISRFVIKKTARKRSSKNMQVTCPKFWHKCDGECRHGISDHKE